MVEVSVRIGTHQHSLYKWIKAYGAPAEQRQAQASQVEELRRLKAEFRCATEECDISKRAAAYLVHLS